jgi:TolB protein
MSKEHRHTILDRRQALRFCVLAAGAVMLPGFASAQRQGAANGGLREFSIDEANVRPRPIAIPDFISEDPQLGRELANIVAADLERSGLFRPLPPGAFIEQLRSVDQPPRSQDWAQIGAEGVVVGEAKRAPDGRVQTRFRLWDTVLRSGTDLGGKALAAPQSSYRRIAHMVADYVYEKFTLEKGYFDTRIVFVEESGPKDRRRKRLAIMDQDGANVRYLSQGAEIVLTPRFSPTRQEIAYMTYVQDLPHVVVMNLDTLQREIVLSDLRGMTFAPRFSPDGQRLVMSYQETSTSNIIELDLRTRGQPRRLTSVNAIDTGACYAPNGQQIVFESDREGTQQLYVMAAQGSPPRRISTGDGRYSTPVWSPRGDWIAFTKQQAGMFLIGVMRPDGSGERILTEDYHNEGPTWSPNGRVVMFFREQRGAQGGPRLFSIDLTGYNEREVPTPGFASDPAWSPLLS